MITILHRGGYGQKITVLHREGGVYRDPQKWLRNLWMTPYCKLNVQTKIVQKCKDGSKMHTIFMYWCTVNRTFHRANPTTLKHFVRQFFFFLIVSNGGWNDESYKKIEYLFIFVPYLSVLKVREWIYVDVEWIYVDVDRPRFQEKNYTTVSTDHLVQFLNGFAIFHKAQHTHGLWKIAKPLKDCTWWSVEPIV